MERLKTSVGRYSTLWISIFTFLYLFRPNLFSVDVIYLLDFFMLAYIIAFASKVEIFNGAIVMKLLAPFLSYFLCLQCFFMLTNGANDAYVSNILSVLFPIINIVLVVLFYEAFLEKHMLDASFIIKCVLIASTMQIVCVFLAFLSPAIRDFFLRFSIDNGSEIMQNVLINSHTLDYRGYGFAANLFDSFTYVLSLICVICLNEFFQKRYVRKENFQGAVIYIILLVGLLFACLINARTGVLLSVFGMLIVFWSYRRLLDISKLFRIIIGVSVLLTFGFFILNSLSEVTYAWVTGGFNEVINLVLHGERTGTFNALFNIDFPDDVLLGMGGEPYQFSFKRIDMGYMRCIWKFGLIGTILFFASLFGLFIHYFKRVPDGYKPYIVAGSVLFSVYFIKLLPISNVAANFLLFGLPAIIIKQNKDFKIWRNFHER